MSVACLPIPHSGLIERDRLAVRQETRLLAVIWTAVLGLGLVRTWASRYTVNADGISYMDMAIAIAEGRWAEAINGYWSPAYPVLLGCVFRVLHPSPAYEAAVAHGVNFIIFALACASFHLLWSELMRIRDATVRLPPRPTGEATTSLPRWALWTLGYGLFAWASMELVTLARVGPDLLLTAFTYLAAGLIARLRGGDDRRRIYILLGLVLGLGYLAKTPMFPLAGVFVVIAGLAGRSRRRSLAGAALAMLIFCMVAGPFVAVLSLQKGRPTIGDSGRINYALHVSAYDPAYKWHDLEGANPLFGWHGEIVGLGTAVHPKRVLHDGPIVEEFDAPVGGSYPFWYDPSWWYEGLQAKGNPRGQLAAVINSAAAMDDV
ncbi:MAG: hypothetical protein HY718_20635, partial [Planctomycetes bacterium]|nr:hypothetical protein [Planctomycetota bacterium]